MRLWARPSRNRIPHWGRKKPRPSVHEREKSETKPIRKLSRAASRHQVECDGVGRPSARTARSCANETSTSPEARTGRVAKEFDFIVRTEIRRLHLVQQVPLQK